ncbi:MULTISPECIES: hypothetical protein [Pontibacillus]|uniref:Phage protein n=1 Tax=Pontibacillus chungwhensis TaxID=265426 RepID=A0ABY8V0F9_9BACI|nr:MULTISPECIES: hypothetical protein [Pontibacillus]MCD5324753.1 hypothetical protein [Pontibacillus sp. HN14]WIF98712.1 hypothetical protein QNI29_03410 [Pontibacillus chungwhensis]
MNLESSVKDAIAKKLSDGTVEKLIEEQVEEGIKKALKDLFGLFGDANKVIEQQLKSVMVPYLEKYDYSQYVTKLDAVLVDVLKSSSLDNKQLLDNFKNLMSPETEKVTKITELFEQWKEYVAHNVDTDDLEVDLDDEPSYEPVAVSVQVEFMEDRSWSSFQNGMITFECEHDETLNIQFPVHRWEKFDKEEWTIDYKTPHDLSSLKRLDEFEVLLMKMNQNNTKIIVDEEMIHDDVYPEEEPEASF